ncbi:acyltransferase family protein [Massilia sp. DWR3-1-1]|uniref:acyltransferase family protein n=1 Tax=Massilia sp. DWR3-1-1 TaxID=2804559 RepID=UPI003CE6C652
MPAPSNTVAPSAGGRLYFLDWVRIVAFFVLILYHVGMYYVKWDWHVKSPYASDAIEGLMMLSGPWRLALLFLVAGVASRLMLGSTGPAGFVRRRSWRLLLPLVFGMLVIVPPQPFCEVIEKFGYTGSYGDFLGLYLHNDRRFVTGPGTHLVMPTWNHLWFVVYLWAYSMLLAALFAVSGQHWERWSAGFGRLLSGWRLLVLPSALLAAIRLGLLDRFPVTHALFDDWFNHAVYLSIFLTGALLARQGAVWASMARQRFVALGLALAVWAMLKVYFSLPDELVPAATMAWLQPVQRLVYALGQWTAIVAACGFAYRHLNGDSARRRYLAEAVFPVYIVHQTLIVLMAHYLKPVRLAPLTEGSILVVLTVCGSFAVFEIVRRVGVLRPLFGLGPRAAADRVEAAPGGRTLAA